MGSSTGGRGCLQGDLQVRSGPCQLICVQSPSSFLPSFLPSETPNAPRSVFLLPLLQSGPIKDQLQTIDYPGTNTTNVFTKFDKMKYGPPPFDGKPATSAPEYASPHTIRCLTVSWRLQHCNFTPVCCGCAAGNGPCAKSADVDVQMFLGFGCHSS